MSVIYCDVNLGTLNQTIYLEENGITTPISNVPTNLVDEAIAGLCYGTEIYNVKLSGPAGYLDKIIEGIKSAESTVYALNNIEIEVIE